MPKAESGPRVVTEPHVQGRAVPGAVSAQAGEEDEEQTGRIHGGGGKRRVLTGGPLLISTEASATKTKDADILSPASAPSDMCLRIKECHTSTIERSCFS